MNANERKRNVKRAWWSQQQFGVTMWTQQWKTTICFNAMDAQWHRDRDAVISQGTPIGLCESAIDLSMRLYCDYKRANGTLVALLETLLCSHGDTTLFYCVFIRAKSHDAHFVQSQSVRRLMAFYNVLGIPSRRQRWSAVENFTACILAFCII